jgi:hypothetical protein
MNVLDDLRVSWTALTAAPDETGHAFAILPLPDPPAGLAILLGRDIEGHRHLLVPRLAEDPPVDDHASQAVHLVTTQLGGREHATYYTDLVCLVPELAEVFDDLVLAVLREIEEAPERPAEACAYVLDEWRAMLRPPPREALSTGQAAGLVAELHTAIDLIRRDPQRRMDVWQGPAGGRHDFRRGRQALEVKATLSHGPAHAEIHGIEQLEPPDGGSLHLVWMRLERVPGGSLTVTDLVDQLRRMVGGTPSLYALLEGAGWRPARPAELLGFELRERRLLLVQDPMPRLTRQNLVGETVPAGVDNIRYTIGLDLPDMPHLTGREEEVLLTEIATGRPDDA